MSEEAEWSWKRTFWLVLLLLPIAGFATFAGVRWLHVAGECLEIQAFSPDGSKFVGVRSTIYYNDYTDGGIFVFDAQTGQTICDLTEFYPSPGRLSWSSDGKRLVGVSNGSKDRQVVVVALEENVARRITDPGNHYQSENLFDVTTFNELGQTVFAQYLQEEAERETLEFVVGNEIVGSIEYGQDEELSHIRAVGKGCLFVAFEPTMGPATGGPAAGRDLVMTDGKSSTCLFVDPTRGERIELPKTSRVLGDRSEFFAETIPAGKAGKQNLVIRHFREPEKKLLTTTKEGFWMPFVSSDGKRLIKHSYSLAGDRITVYDFDSGEKRELATPAYRSIRPTSDGQCMLFTRSGKLVRLNLDDGSHRELVNLRPFCFGWYSLAISAFISLWVVALTIGIHWKTKHPFFEMTCLLLISWFVVIGWSALGTNAFLARIDIESAGFVFLGATFTFFMHWASTAKSFWGATLPCCLVGAAANVGVMFLWARGNAYRVVEGTIGCTFLLVMTLLGLWLVRKRFGRVGTEADFANSSDLERAESQLSLKLSALRFVDLTEFVGIPGAAMFVVWLVTYALTMCAISITASIAALRLRDLLASAIVFLVAAGLASGFHFMATRSWNIHLMWSEFTRYALIVAAAALVWIACRYCRAKGYRFERSAA